MNPAEFANIAAAEQSLWWYRGMRYALLDFISPWLRGRQVRRVLEAGCGTGHFARILEQERGWHVFPADIAWEGLSFARSNGLKRLSQADLSALPFTAGSFDVVSSLDVLAHFRPGDEAAPLRELSRVLTPGGLLVLRASALNWLRSRHSQFVNERQRFTRRRLVQAVSDAGVRVLRCTYVNALLLPVAWARFRVWEPLLGKPPASGIGPLPRWLDSLLYGCLHLEARWLSSGRNLPAGQSLILIGEKAA